jgi:hypothetical protein
MSALQYALKEWAVVCRALAQGRQALLLRKGGIAETAGRFQVEHERFWLFPTYVHQQREGIVEEAAEFLERVESERPPPGVVRLTHFAEIKAIYHVDELYTVEKLAGLHIWSPPTVESRFAYRESGLFVLAARVYRSAEWFDLPDKEEYAGCRSWVQLERSLPIDGATPVLSDEEFAMLLRQLNLLLEPSAFA